MIKYMLLGIGGLLLLILLVTGIRIVLLRHSVGVYSAYWQKENAKPLEPGALVYIALGDSTAQGIGASNPRKGYVGLMADYIAQQTGKKVQVINISVSGAKVDDLVKTQLPQLKNLPKPDFMTVEIGANDIGAFNADSFKIEYTDFLNGLPAGVIVSDVPSFKGTIHGNLDAKVLQANQIITLLMAEKPQFYVAHLYADTSNQGYFNGAADTFHPNDHGYKNWAKAFKDTLDTNNLLKK
jgi:acyl-CoA thioesterase-1